MTNYEINKAFVIVSNNKICKIITDQQEALNYFWGLTYSFSAYFENNSKFEAFLSVIEEGQPEKRLFSIKAAKESGE